MEWNGQMPKEQKKRFFMKSRGTYRKDMCECEHVNQEGQQIIVVFALMLGGH